MFAITHRTVVSMCWRVGRPQEQRHLPPMMNSVNSPMVHEFSQPHCLRRTITDRELDGAFEVLVPTGTVVGGSCPPERGYEVGRGSERWASVCALFAESVFIHVTVVPTATFVSSGA